LPNSGGKFKFENIIEGITYREESDEQTGHREKVVIETKDKTKIPTIIVEGKEQSNTTFRLVRISL
jgi:DNA-directed RNA polymerase subunit beta'